MKKDLIFEEIFVKDFKIGDICIFLRNGNLPSIMFDYGSSIRSVPIDTVMSPNYFFKRCEVIGINRKIYDVFTSYRIKFLDDGKITFCKDEQLKKLSEDITSELDTEKKKMRTDADIRYQIMKDTIDGLLVWNNVKDKGILYFRSNMKIDDLNNTELIFDIFRMGNDNMILNIYYKRNKNVIFVKRIDKVAHLYDEILKKNKI